MSTDLESMIADLAARWESASPAISAEEVMLASRAPIWSDEIAVESERFTPSRGRTVLLAVAATAALIALVVAVLDSRKNSTPIGPAPATTESPVSSVTSPPATTTTEVAPTTTTPADPFGQMEAERTAALSSFDSLSFTATVSEVYDGQPENTTGHTNDVVLRNDGSLWATGDQFLMNSFDAQAGVARAHFLQLDGAVGYQEVLGWSDNSVPLMTMLGGIDPTGSLGVGDGDGSTIQETSLDGRDVWLVTRGMPEAEQTDTWTVDRTTGLIVRYDVDWVYDGASLHARRSVVISDVVLGAQLPPEFPGSFPEGAVVDRSGDPSGFRLATVAEAAAEFGDGLVVPADLAGDARITISTWDSSLSDPAAVAAGTAVDILAPTINLEIITRVGFTRTVMNLTKMRPPPTGVPEGFVVIGDAICATTDGVACTVWNDESRITQGAWGGAPSSLERTSISAELNGVTLSINAPTAEQALTLANSLSPA